MADTSGGDTPQPTAEALAAENERLKDELARAESGRRPPLRLRRFFTVVLVVLTSLSVVLATVGIWANRTVWNQDRYLALVTPIAQDPAVTNALAAELTDEVFTALDLQGRITDVIDQIPKASSQAAFVAGSITSALHNVVQDRVSSFLASDTFQGLWVQINTRLHTKIVALLNGDYAQLPNLTVNGGDVQLNLIPAVISVIQQVLPDLGINVTLPTLPANLDASAAISALGARLGVSLPSDFAQITVMSADQLHSLQTGARYLKRIGYGLVALVLVLGALALIVSVERRKTLVWLGVGAAAGLLIGLPIIRAIEGQIVNAITTPGARSTARDIFQQVASGLRRIAIVIAILSLLVALIAHLFGRPRWFESVKTQARGLSEPGASPLVAFTARNADRLRLGLIVVAVVLLIWIGIGWISVVVIGGLLALALWGVTLAQRQVPEAELPGTGVGEA
jgi:hypothetical protein